MNIANSDETKYIKYKTKYIQLKKNIRGGSKKKLKKRSNKNFNQHNRMDMINLNNSDNSDNSDNLIKPDYIEHLSEPWFSLISLGLKTVEGRRNKGKFANMQVGEIVKWFNNDFEPRHIYTKITGKTVYDTFENYLNSEGLENCLPGIQTLPIGLSVYFKYYTKEDEKNFGVVAIKFELIR